MTGYHYTSYKNWLEIKKQGLVPYLIDLKDHRVPVIKGVWLWTQNPIGISHLGNIIRQLAFKSETRIVKLQVNYNYEKRYRLNFQEIKLTHQGIIEKFQYHIDDPSIIITEPIGQKDIKLLKSYDLLDLLT